MKWNTGITMLSACCGYFLLNQGCIPTEKLSEHPNILWIIAEDMSCDFHYQGNNLVSTPNVDMLAEEGVEFSNAYVTAPVCSASRSALITGIYQTSIGSHNHRSSRGENKIYLPERIKPVPFYFKEAGYYVCNMDEGMSKQGKTDYNFVYERDSLYDAPNLESRKKGQPFFAQVQLRGGKLRDVEKWYNEVESDLSQLVSAGQVSIPPYYPDVTEIREDWARYLNSVQYTDKEVGHILENIKEIGEWNNTVIFFITDHGISHARGKQFLYDEGTKIPFVVWAPGRIKPGKRDDLINHIDMAATSLYFAGIKIPDPMEGQPLFGPGYREREYIVSARDRCDETVDRIRSIRSGDFKYIRNYYPERPYLQPCVYKDQKPTLRAIRRVQEEGGLDSVQSLVTAETRPKEELYDLNKDPWEIHNLAEDPRYQNTQDKMRGTLEKWIQETGDKGQSPEPEEWYDSEMAVYLNAIKRNPVDYAILLNNIEVMKKWSIAGK